MKKKVLILVSICIIAGLNLFLSVNKSNDLISFVSTSPTGIESFADPGESDQSWLQPETKRCKHELGGGWFESSVERICTFCAVPYSCTPVACGDAF